MQNAFMELEKNQKCSLCSAWALVALVPVSERGCSAERMAN